MKSYAVFLVLVLAATFARAETLYVGERVEANVRKGGGTEFRVLTIARVGTAVEVLEKGRGWTKVRLPNGRQGWILTRYLADTPPPRKRVAALEKEREILMAKAKELTKANQTLEEKNKNLASALETQASKAEALDEAHQTLLAESQEFFAVKKSLKQARQNLAAARKESREAGQALEELRFGTGVRWFLAGAGVLVAGFILGRLLAPKRRRSSLLR